MNREIGRWNEKEDGWNVRRMNRWTSGKKAGDGRIERLRDMERWIEEENVWNESRMNRKTER